MPAISMFFGIVIYRLAVNGQSPFATDPLR